MKLYCDLDGCLVDFETNVLRQMNRMLVPILLDREHPLQKVAADAVKELGGVRKIVLRDIERDTFDDGDLPFNKMTRRYMRKLVGDDHALWASLGWERSGKSLWSFIKNISGIEILSAPMNEGSRTGKYAWCERELDLPRSRVNLMTNKATLAVSDGVPAVLIDDRDRHINEFRAAGGLAIKHNPDNVVDTIRQLKNLGF